jgi:uncharacterized protein YeaO (DUF488 family)
MEIGVKHVLDPPEDADGFRILVEERMPAGHNARELKINLWLRKIAPGEDLAFWFGHDPQKWEQFRTRYAAELDGRLGVFEFIIDKLLHGGVTLLYERGDREHNYAEALKQYIDNNYLIVEET